MVVVLLGFCVIYSHSVRLGVILFLSSMDQCAEVPSAEVVSAIDSDSCDMMSFERFHDHAALHNTPMPPFRRPADINLKFRFNYRCLRCVLGNDEAVITTIVVSLSQSCSRSTAVSVRDRVYGSS